MARRAASHGPDKSPGAPSGPRKWPENLGFVVIAILILVIAITRFWHNIHWSMR
ncbi:MAG: hypothetical protein J2P13_11400 [Acidobacteria bacterium]|nr:hypothetical protein [Acidobacteriota bacterium]